MGGRTSSSGMSQQVAGPTARIETPYTGNSATVVAQQEAYRAGVQSMEGVQASDRVLRGIFGRGTTANTTPEVARALGQLEAVVGVGDTLTRREYGRPVNEVVKRTAGGWEYTRTNTDTGQVYEKSQLSGASATTTLFDFGGSWSYSKAR